MALSRATDRPRRRLASSVVAITLELAGACASSDAATPTDSSSDAVTESGDVLFDSSSIHDIELGSTTTHTMR